MIQVGTVFTRLQVSSKISTPINHNFLASVPNHCTLHNAPLHVVELVHYLCVLFAVPVQQLQHVLSMRISLLLQPWASSNLHSCMNSITRDD